MKKTLAAVAAAVLVLAVFAVAPSAEAWGKDRKVTWVKKVVPEYPDEARKERIEGKVVVRLDIDEEGVVREATVVEGPEALRQAAVDTVTQWRAEGTGEAYDFHVTINYRLTKDGEKKEESSGKTT